MEARWERRDCIYMTSLDHVQAPVWIPWNVEVPSWLEFYFCHVRSKNPLSRFSLGGMLAEVKYQVYLCQQQKPRFYCQFMATSVSPPTNKRMENQ